MKILSPVDKVEEVEKVIEAGAGELYCGLLTSDWHDKYVAGSINRRPGGRESFTSFDELRDCVSIAHSYDVPVFLTLNEHYYIYKQYPFILDYVKKVVDIGVDALMVSDLALILTLQEIGINTRIFVSIGGAAFNSEAVKFYQDLGASRIVLPRHLTVEEISEISKNVSDIELEVFILNSRCPNVDGFCTFHHGLADRSFALLHRNACMLPYEISVAVQDANDASELSSKRQHIWESVHTDEYPCGACALYEFNEMGIAGVKIVGRGNPTARKIADVTFIRSLLDLLGNEKPSRADFRQIAQDTYTNLYKQPCRICRCYYPVLPV